VNSILENSYYKTNQLCIHVNGNDKESTDYLDSKNIKYINTKEIGVPEAFNLCIDRAIYNTSIITNDDTYFSKNWDYYLHQWEIEMKDKFPDYLQFIGYRWCEPTFGSYPPICNAGKNVKEFDVNKLNEYILKNSKHELGNWYFNCTYPTNILRQCKFSPEFSPKGNEADFGLKILNYLKKNNSKYLMFGVKDCYIYHFQRTASKKHRPQGDTAYPEIFRKKWNMSIQDAYNLLNNEVKRSTKLIMTNKTESNIPNQKIENTKNIETKTNIDTNYNNIKGITIETSTICNARCKLCPNHTNPRKPYLTPLDDFERTLRLFPELMSVTLCGMYEPLADKRLDKIFEIIKTVNPNMEINIFTNASLLDRWEDLILDSKNNVLNIIFSVHGFSKNVYNEMMKGLDRDKTYNNIIHFCEQKKLRGLTKPNTSTAIVTTSLNKNEIKDFKEFWSHYTDNVSNFELMSWNGTVANYKSLLDKPKRTTRKCPMYEAPLVIDALGNVVRCCYCLSNNYGEVSKDGINNWINKKWASEKYPDLDCLRCDGWRFY